MGKSFLQNLLYLIKNFSLFGAIPGSTVPKYTLQGLVFCTVMIIIFITLAMRADPYTKPVIKPRLHSNGKVRISQQGVPSQIGAHTVGK